MDWGVCAFSNGASEQENNTFRVHGFITGKWDTYLDAAYSMRDQRLDFLYNFYFKLVLGGKVGGLV
jgi:hypothetical protein